MKKFSLAVAAGLLASATFAASSAPTWIEFSSTGPDKYADGTVVQDGEIYALVYIKGDSFAGIKPDGSVVDPATSKIICRAPVAKNGKCPQITYALEGTKEGGFQYTGGRFEVFLLDTRVSHFDNEGNKTGVTVGLKEGGTVYSGWQSIASTVSAASSIASAEAKTISAGNVPVLDAKDADGLKPVISGMDVFDGNVYITVANTRSTLKYEISGYKTLGDTNPKAFCEGVQGAAKEGDVIQLVYKDDPNDRYTFFKVKVSGVNVK